MKKYSVSVLPEAEGDLLAIYHFVAVHDTPGRAAALLGALEKVISGLESLPERGHFPPELEGLGMHSHREIHYKPYRIIYELSGHNVVIHMVADGRRSFRDLLEQRLLR